MARAFIHSVPCPAGWRNEREEGAVASVDSVRSPAGWKDRTKGALSRLGLPNRADRTMLSHTPILFSSKLKQRGFSGYLVV
jgi:hypothetical protein